MDFVLLSNGRILNDIFQNTSAALLTLLEI